MPRKPKVKTITVIGRRWFRKTYGNTYSSAQVLVNGETIAKLGPTGGYGNYYLQMASEWLTQQGLINPEKYSNGSSEPLWSYAERNKIKLEYSAIDVPRERDL